VFPSLLLAVAGRPRRRGCGLLALASLLCASDVALCGHGDAWCRPQVRSSRRLYPQLAPLPLPDLFPSLSLSPLSICTEPRAGLAHLSWRAFRAGSARKPARCAVPGLTARHEARC
jgi:hypothetical protein